ncbi:pilus assembly protein CpaE [Acidocella aquatica]|uniref:Pilus assembly protein CpaE n=1 Tax=Acidocella aquatica TaxID=1922313 RepID=A0ABQ6A6S1_9PROT|nr:histidine kinase [Acidocella aquatica]GLR65898.1 pilus assembly protein CpaE [Acidocella aquatica]
MSQQGPRVTSTDGGLTNRPDRLTVLAFLGDPATEQVLRDGLGDQVANGMDIRRGTVRTAIAAMAKLQTPEVLIVDIAGEEQPLHALGELSDVVEPGVRVLVIGDTDDVDFYRHITRGMGVMEYIFKPITREAVARYFAPLVTRKTVGQDATRGGRVIAVMGARGGVGSTTIAGNLAWLLGVIAKRHTVFLESDLHMGSGALLLGAKTGPGLRMALETPDRIDPLFVERAAQPVAERLQVLASEEKLNDPLNYAPGAARRLIETLRVRYNFIIMDVPFLPMQCNRELIEYAHHRVIVMDPSLASVRDTLRLLGLPNGPWQPQSPTIVLNRQGRPGGLTRKQIEEALKVKIDVVIPDIPKQLNESASFGDPAVTSSGPFRQAIIDLSREIGFVGGREDGGVAGSSSTGAVSGLFKMFGLQKG